MNIIFLDRKPHLIQPSIIFNHRLDVRKVIFGSNFGYQVIQVQSISIKHGIKFMKFKLFV